MKLRIAVLPGDGIGPEIMRQGVAVMDAIAAKFGHQVEYHEAICGAHAIDLVGDPFPDDTFQTCMEADAVLFAAVGDPKYDNDPTSKVRPEQGLLAMRKKLGHFANIWPIQTFKCLLQKSPLRLRIRLTLRLRASPRRSYLTAKKSAHSLLGGLNVRISGMGRVHFEEQRNRESRCTR